MKRDMKKIFIMMIMAAIMVGCHKDDITSDTLPIQDGDVKSYSGKLTLNVSQNVTKAVTGRVSWEWEEGDIIFGYQNYGGRTINKLIFKGENTFECENFVYSTNEPKQFCFFYDGRKEFDGPNITVLQDGTWRPLLRGSTNNTTLSDIQQVKMEYCNVGMQFQLFFDKKIPFNIKEAKLTSEKDIVGKWELSDSKTIGTPSGKEITITLPEPSNTVEFNLLPIEENVGFTITLTTIANETITREFNSDELDANDRYMYMIDAEVSVNLPSASEFNTIIKNAINASGDEECTKISFFTNEMPPDNDEYEILGDISNSAVPIYLVKYMNTLEIYTPADKFKLPNNCEKMFADFSSITNIVGEDYWDTSEVTNMKSMFEGCSNMKGPLDLSKFSTSKVTDMSRMFYNCESMTNIIFGENFSISQVTDMSYMFYNCKNIAQTNYTNLPGTPQKQLDLSSFIFTYDTVLNHVNMECMFDFNSARTVQVYGIHIYEWFESWVKKEDFRRTYDNQFLGDDYVVVRGKAGVIII